MTQLLPRFIDTRIADERKVAKIILETSAAPPAETVARATLAGDSRRLRGIPCVAMNVSGASPGTIPHVDGVRFEKLRGGYVR